MKPKILHCVDDPNMGGVNFALQSLCGSTLQDDFAFDIQYIDFSTPVNINSDADIICLHGASNWRNLLNIIQFKWRHPNTTFVLQEHHYSAAFVSEQIRSPKRFYLMLKLNYWLMDKVIAIAPSQQQWMLEHKLISQQKIALLGQGRDLTRFTASVIASQIPNKSPNKSQDKLNANEAPVLAAYGRFHPQKGFDLLIKAMQQVKSPCRLLLAGEGGQLDELNALAAKVTNVEIVGKIDDVPSFLQACDAVIIPSRWEPFGLIFIESLAMNKPIISSQVDGLGDQINQHTDHHLIDDGHQSAITAIAEPISADSIADAINHFLSQTAATSLVDAQATEECQVVADSQVTAVGSVDSNPDYIEQWKALQWLELQQAWKSLFKQLLEDKKES
ncbi:glycosyltransferase family 4 protein [Shewanella sp. 10N.7]|uniref:glycosyltransferase family 4 protein n=1 Tax=Shewanella sp. 10N.7 TaxID=2885093 RepID=UPI001E3D33F2|nr:glycosyltransferase family 4 protein [Shewanella sp. 10N.7]MCC4834752.1 glycosyltransferase family 4 protein [Shewanella sp. 10N.7]